MRGKQVHILEFESFIGRTLECSYETADWLWDEVAMLDDLDRKVITAKYRQDLSGKMFADAIGTTSTRQADRWLNRALDRLKRRVI